jgi:wobble nucleotide-excising tRNase
MIEKILKIKGIGLLHDGVTRAKKFSKITVIYGENARGKSTLATIFSSLAQNNPSIIGVRETLDGTQDPEVDLRIDGSNYIYKDGAWNQGCSNIVIFDSVFVNDNVYSGFEVSSDQRRSLLEFTLGEEGGQLICDVDVLTRQIANKTAEIRDQEQEIEKICYPLPASEYVNLPEDPDIEKSIQTTERYYISVKNADIICSYTAPSQIVFTSPSLTNFQELLTVSLSDISEDAKTRVIAHMNAHMKEHNEQWIKDGLSLKKSENCPFCGQDLKAADQLIGLYQKFFDESYQKHQMDLQELNEIIADNLSDGTLTELAQTCNNNEQLINSIWKKHNIGKFSQPISGETIKRELTLIREEFQKILEAKLLKPTIASDKIEIFHSASEKYHSILSQIERYNNDVKTFNANIESIKKGLKTADSQEISNRLDNIKRQQKRHLSPNKELCDKYNALLQEKGSLEKDKKQARARLESFTNKLLDRYENEMNHYLDYFNAGFRIANVDTSHEKGTPRMKYQLKIRDLEIPLGSPKNAADTPGFSNTLSDGDKRTLAFSFFMAKNKLDPSISDKIVIVDDPMSSFDQSRQRATQKELKNLALKANQLVVLSHDPSFLQAFLQNGDFNSSDVIVYEIKRAPGDYSSIEDCDIEECIQTVYKRNYQLVSQYIEDPRGRDKLSVVRAIRPLLEANLRMRFQHHLKGANSLGIMIKLIKESQEGNPLRKMMPNIQKIEDINGYTTSHTHDTDADGNVQKINDAELKRFASLAMEVVQ